MHGRQESPPSPQPQVGGVPLSPRRLATRRRTLAAKNLTSLPPGDDTDGVVSGLTLWIRNGGRFWALRYRAR
jgi:hypothetical protein